MRTLALSEIEEVSGGHSHISTEMWDAVSYKASRDAVMMTFLIGGGISTVIGVATASIAASTPIGIFAGLATGIVITPYIGIYHYKNSSQWNIIYNQFEK